MTEQVFENFSYLHYAALVVAVILIAVLLRLLFYFCRRMRFLEHLHLEEGNDDAAKAEFKCRIHRSYLLEERRNRDKLKLQINKAVMFRQNYHFQKLPQAVVFGIIRRTLLEFRLRFFKNLRLALIQKAKKHKGKTAHLTHMQQDSIREMMYAMGLKSKKSEDAPRPAPHQQEENLPTAHEVPHQQYSIDETERERREREWMKQETRIKEMQVSLERKNLDKPPEIRRAAVNAGFYANDSLKKHP